MRPTVVSAILIALTGGACSTTPDETALADEKTTALEADTSPATDVSSSDIETPELAANGDTAPAEEPPAPKKVSGDPETVMRESFAAGDLDALPALDDALSTNPGQLKPLMRGAFAGVGNDTEKCEDILLYLTVRHGHLATDLTTTAAEINPEIQSWAQ